VSNRLYSLGQARVAHDRRLLPNIGQINC